MKLTLLPHCRRAETHNQRQKWLRSLRNMVTLPFPFVWDEKLNYEIMFYDRLISPFGPRGFMGYLNVFLPEKYIVFSWLKKVFVSRKTCLWLWTEKCITTILLLKKNGQKGTCDCGKNQTPTPVFWLLNLSLDNCKNAHEDLGICYFSGHAESINFM